jgi:hypothetical protein
MQVVDRHAPVTAREDERNHRWELSDGFMRFCKNDGLHWPRRDGLKWPRLASVVVGVDVA